MKHKEDENTSESFLREVNAVSKAEEMAQKLNQEAQKESERLINNAQAESVKILSQASKEAVDAKNKVISNSRKDTQRRVDEILNKAHKKAEELSSKRLTKRAIDNIVDSL